MFDANQLRRGDMVLIQVGSKQKAGEVIHAKAYDTIGIRLADKNEKWFGSRTGFDNILAGARLVDGQWRVL